MQNDDTYSEILALINTPPERDKIIGQIDLVLSAEFMTGTKKEEVLNSSLKQLANKDENYLKKLKEILVELPEVKLTLAFDPKLSFFRKITSWLEKTTGKKTLVNITVDSQIVGGAIIEYQGKYTNLSLSALIDEKVTSNLK